MATAAARIVSLAQRFRRCQRGFVLPLTLGISTVLAIVGTTAITYTTSGARTASRSTADQKAYALAEAGVNDALAVLSLPSNNALDPYLLPSTTVAYDGGTVTYSGTLDQSSGTWTISATGLMRNPTGPNTSPVRRTLGVNVAIDPSYSQPLNNMAWNYIWAKATGSTCDMTIGQSVNVATPLYVEGNLCLQNSATISSGPLVVKGSLTMTQKANGVGQPSAAVNEAHIGGACQYWNKAANYPCKGSPDNVYARTLDQNVPALTPPTADWTKWYLNADPGPYYPCVEKSGTPPVFDNDQTSASAPNASTRNNSVLTVFDLTPALSYSCKTAAGELSWNALSDVLTVKGTVYIDGSVVVDNGGTDTYDGQGSLYVSGTVLIKNTKLCAVADGSGNCSMAGWDPNSRLLVLVADGHGGQAAANDSIQLVSATFQGALYATSAIENDTTSSVIGPMIGSTVILGQSVTTSFPAIRIVPTGMPALQNTIYAQPRAPTGYTG
jgi:Tfp pilus assembly protein PilX